MSIIKAKYQDVFIERLIDDAIEHLRLQGLAESTLTANRNVWLQVKLYMSQNNLRFYSPEIGEEFLQIRFKNLGIKFSENWAYRLSALIGRLNEFWETGSVHKRTKLSPSFESALGKSIDGFLCEKESQKRFSDNTIRQNRYYLSVFLDYANRHGLHELDCLCVEVINQFLDSLPHGQKSLRHHVIRDLRLYLSYAYEKGTVRINLSGCFRVTLTGKRRSFLRYTQRTR